jgi:hypothetical protein
LLRGGTVGNNDMMIFRRFLKANSDADWGEWYRVDPYGLVTNNNSYETVTINSSGQTYTATKNGYFELRVYQGKVASLYINSPVSSFAISDKGSTDADRMVTLWMNRGQTVTISHNGTSTAAKFFYVQAQSEIS